MSVRELFSMPRPIKVNGRSSSITNAFVNSIVPTVEPTEEQIARALSILGMDQSNYSCSYCGDQASEWDHLFPLVNDKMPTGYISEIYNLVPACGKCNQSKGNKDWKAWMLSDAPRSPKSKGVPDVADRIRRLVAYAQWGPPVRIDFEAVVAAEDWQRHWASRDQILASMNVAQVLADSIRKAVAKQLRLAMH